MVLLKQVFLGHCTSSVSAKVCADVKPCLFHVAFTLIMLLCLLRGTQSISWRWHSLFYFPNLWLLGITTRSASLRTVKDTFTLSWKAITFWQIWEFKTSLCLSNIAEHGLGYGLAFWLHSCSWQVGLESKPDSVRCENFCMVQCSHWVRSLNPNPNPAV